MSHTDNYSAINKQSWNKRTELHWKSDFYDIKKFIAGADSLNSIELDLLGNIEGKKVLHLQCHFGQDTLSLARRGALVTGVDLSDNAIDKARELAAATGLSARFICCDVYELHNHLQEEFDIIFTSYGVIGWLPDLTRWAGIIHRFLQQDGYFIMAEFHPVVWMFNDDFSQVSYNYFNEQPIVETVNGTYAAKDAPVSLETISWNHSLGEVLDNLLNYKIQLITFKEFDYSPYNCFNHTIEVGEKQYRIKHLHNYIPMVYALKAQKKAE